MNFIIFIRENLLCIPTTIEIVKQERQHFRVVLVHFKLSEFTPHIIIPKRFYQIPMGIEFIRIRQIIFKILTNSLSVPFHQIVYLFLFQLRSERLFQLDLLQLG